MKTEIDYYLIGGLPGFSQDWFPVGWMRLGGCAAVTACDASIMLARDEGLTALCPCDPSHVTRQSYLDFADVMRPYLHPRWGGIDTLKIYIDGFGQYICDVGADEAISLSGVEGNEPWEKARDAIREQIDRGRVVPFLTLYHQNRKFAEYECAGRKAPRHDPRAHRPRRLLGESHHLRRRGVARSRLPVGHGLRKKRRHNIDRR